MKIDFYDIGKVDDKILKFAIIFSKFQDKWILVRHKDRDTWEIPGGHREIGENIDETAKRELFEETGAKKFQIKSVCDYSVTINNITTYGRLFFTEIEELDMIPNFEIEEIQLFEDLPDNLTYAEIQPHLFEKIKLLKPWGNNEYEKICPICGQYNNCQSHEKECWCFHMEIPKGIFHLVPEDKKGKACICKSCIEKYREENS